MSVQGICPNCEQYVRDGDCFNECNRRGFADKPLPLPKCPVYGQAQPCCITSGPAPYFVTGVNHVCGR